MTEKKLLTTSHVPIRQIQMAGKNYKKNFEAIDWAKKYKPEVDKKKQMELKV